MSKRRRAELLKQCQEMDSVLEGGAMAAGKTTTLDRLKALEKAAKRKTWTLGGEGRECHRYIGDCIAPSVARMRAHYAKDRKRDGALIVAAVNALPALLRLVDAVDEIRDWPELRKWPEGQALLAALRSLKEGT